MSVYELKTKRHRPWRLAAFTAAGIAFPLTLFQVGGDPVHVTLFLIPAALLAWVSSRDPAVKWLFVAFLGGFAAYAIVVIIQPSSGLIRPLSSLVLIVGTASFSFLGMTLRRRVGKRAAIDWLAVASAVFIFVIGGRLLVGRMPVRTYIGPAETALAVFNARVAGFEVFGSFGVLSLAYLVVLQVIVICSAASVRGRAISYRLLLWGAVAVGCYLVIGSGSRSAQGSLVVLVIALIGRNLLVKRSFSSVVLGLVCSALAIWFFVELEAGGRLIETVSALMRTDLTSANSSPDITTGRVVLVEQALNDVLRSPIVGTGFTNSIAFGHVGVDASVNSPHLYYLTLFWKGGVLFGVPFLFFLFSLIRRGFRPSAAELAGDNDIFYLRVAVVIAFGFMPFFWDILLVPSAGALAYFLLGVLVEGPRDSVSQMNARLGL